jgi:hypothetical protein
MDYNLQPQQDNTGHEIRVNSGRISLNETPRHTPPKLANMSTFQLRHNES